MLHKKVEYSEERQLKILYGCRLSCNQLHWQVWLAAYLLRVDCVAGDWRCISQPSIISLTMNYRVSPFWSRWWVSTHSLKQISRVISASAIRRWAHLFVLKGSWRPNWTHFQYILHYSTCVPILEMQLIMPLLQILGISHHHCLFNHYFILSVICSSKIGTSTHIIYLKQCRINMWRKLNLGVAVSMHNLTYIFIIR